MPALVLVHPLLVDVPGAGLTCAVTSNTAVMVHSLLQPARSARCHTVSRTVSPQQNSAVEPDMSFICAQICQLRSAHMSRNSSGSGSHNGCNGHRQYMLPSGSDTDAGSPMDEHNA
jgi:hypothetical protein